MSDTEREMARLIGRAEHIIWRWLTGDDAEETKTARSEQWLRDVQQHFEKRRKDCESWPTSNQTHPEQAA